MAPVTPKPYAGPSVNSGRSVVTDAMGRAIAASLDRLRGPDGNKSIAHHFDGREGEPVANSTISRWIKKPRRFPGVFVPVLVELDAEFRIDVFRILTGSLVTDDAVMKRLSAKAAGEYRDAVESLVFEQIKPGVWAR